MASGPAPQPITKVWCLGAASQLYSSLPVSLEGLAEWGTMAVPVASCPLTGIGTLGRWSLALAVHALCPASPRSHGEKEEVANGKVDSSERCQGGKHAIVTLLSNTQLLEKDLRP